MKKWISSKKYLLIFGIAFVVFLMFYGGSYWYLRNNSIRLENQKELVPPPGYYFDIVFGVGISGGKDYPPRGFHLCPCEVNAKNKVEFKMWMVYFYYPLWRSEVAMWRIKTFGWK